MNLLDSCCPAILKSSYTAILLSRDPAVLYACNPLHPAIWDPDSLTAAFQGCDGFRLRLYRGVRP